ncbi:holo-ACP synthase, partial [bacterium]|nr:holo-ACP synthase [bacterium]
GIGIDLIEIERIKKSLQNPRFRLRILTEKERNYCKNEEQVAGRFCAKEAIMKALGRRLPWKDIEITNEDNGKPCVILYGRAKELIGDGEILISISHSRTTAVAVALFIKGSPSREESP